MAAIMCDSVVMRTFPGTIPPATFYASDNVENSQGVSIDFHPFIGKIDNVEFQFID